MLSPVDLEGEIARARAANEQRAADESVAAESKARAATDAERHLRGLLSEAAELLRSRGVAPDVATVRGSGTVLQRFTVRERAWRLDSQWGLTEGGRLASGFHE